MNVSYYGIVAFEVGVSDSFETGNGVKLGCVQAPPLLFSVLLGYTFPDPFGIFLCVTLDGSLFNLTRPKVKILLISEVFLQMLQPSSHTHRMVCICYATHLLQLAQHLVQYVKGISATK